jgi:COMPASS component SWD3
MGVAGGETVVDLLANDLSGSPLTALAMIGRTRLLSSRLFRLRAFSACCQQGTFFTPPAEKKIQMAGTQVDAGDPAPKRRRLNDSAPAVANGQQSPANNESSPSSSDEHAATSDDAMEHRRASWSAKKTTPPRRQYNPQSKSPGGSDTAEDELAMNGDAFWNRNAREQSPAKKAPTPLAEMNGDDAQSGDKMDAEPLTPALIEPNGDADSRAISVEQPERIPTPEPVPPPPPPKPDHVNYVQKHVLKGHLRGVSAVKFSPDRTMIASGGMLLCFC